MCCNKRPCLKEGERRAHTPRVVLWPPHACCDTQVLFGFFPASVTHLPSCLPNLHAFIRLIPTERKGLRQNWLSIDQFLDTASLSTYWTDRETEASPLFRGIRLVNLGSKARIGSSQDEKDLYLSIASMGLILESESKTRSHQQGHPSCQELAEETLRS